MSVSFLGLTLERSRRWGISGGFFMPERPRKALVIARSDILGDR